MKKICETCGVEYNARRSSQKYCSQKCLHQKLKGETVTFKCDYCGKENVKRKCDVKEELKSRFCNKECYGKFRSENYIGEKSNLWNGGQVEFRCDHCGKKSSTDKNAYNKSKNHYCSIECKNKNYGVIYRGENHPNWNPEIDDYDREKGRFIQGYDDFVRGVFERDNYTCQCCNKRGGVKLNAHHLNGYNWDIENRTNVNNAVTLCEDCHKDFHKMYGKGYNTREQFEEWMNNKNKEDLESAS